MTDTTPRAAEATFVASTTNLVYPGGWRFWLAVVLTGILTGASAALLYRLLLWVQALVWSGGGESLLTAVVSVEAWRRVVVLLGAGLVTGAGQLLLVHLASGNGIDINAAIWFTAGRLPKVRTLGSAFLSIVIVGMGASLGREGAPKQAGAVFGDLLADRLGLSDEQRRLLVACGAGAGMSAAYGVPVGGALFSLEVLRGVLALRMVLPALIASVVAAMVGWMVIPNVPLYRVPEYPNGASIAVWALCLSPFAAVVSVLYVRAMAWADRNKPAGWRRVLDPVLVLGALGLVAVRYPEVLGNGRDVSQLAFSGRLNLGLIVAILVLKPLATVLSVRSGAPGGLFTPTLTLGAMLGGLFGHFWDLAWPGTPPGLYALIGAAAVLSATTQGPISTVVLLVEFTGHPRAYIVPLLLAVSSATLIARRIEARSIYDARLTDEQLAARLAARAPSAR